MPPGGTSFLAAPGYHHPEGRAHCGRSGTGRARREDEYFLPKSPIRYSFLRRQVFRIHLVIGDTCFMGITLKDEPFRSSLWRGNDKVVMQTWAWRSLNFYMERLVTRVQLTVMKRVSESIPPQLASECLRRRTRPRAFVCLPAPIWVHPAG